MHGKTQNKLFGHFWLAFVCVFALVILFQPDQQASAQWGWPGAWPYAYGYGYGGYGYGYGWPNWGGWYNYWGKREAGFDLHDPDHFERLSAEEAHSYSNNHHMPIGNETVSSH